MITTNFQDTFLNIVRRERSPVTIVMTNGQQIKCTVSAYDNYVLIVTAEGKQQMLYKHAISSILPYRTVPVRAASSSSSRPAYTNTSSSNRPASSKPATYDRPVK